jgi:PncC family amidohydrolase
MNTRLEEQLGAALRAGGFTLSTAESCTGGLIAHRLTDIPGSSEYILGGIVAYANEIKQRLLHVQEETLIDYGAVSEQTAGEMAVGSQQAFEADFAVSVTGIAGPGGGTVAKPVGLTYIGLAGKSGLLKVERHVWQGDRDANKKASAEAAMRLALEHIRQK